MTAYVEPEREHSPLPWHIDETESIGGQAGWRTMIHADNGRPVASTVYPFATGVWRKEDEANAALIVEAVNNSESRTLSRVASYDLFRSLVAYQGGQGHFPGCPCIGKEGPKAEHSYYGRPTLTGPSFYTTKCQNAIDALKRATDLGVY